MTPAERYRATAAELKAKAACDNSGRTAPELESLALAYLRLAEQADQNSRADVWAEFRSNRPLCGKGER